MQIDRSTPVVSEIGSSLVRSFWNGGTVSGLTRKVNFKGRNEVGDPVCSKNDQPPVRDRRLNGISYQVNRVFPGTAGAGVSSFMVHDSSVGMVTSLDLSAFSQVTNSPV